MTPAQAPKVDLWNDPQDRTLRVTAILAWVLTLGLHIAAYFTVPWQIEGAEPGEHRPVRGPQIRLSLVQPQESLGTFVETNPDAPENFPDDTNNFAARDQQAAQPERAEELSDDGRPTVESEDTVGERVVRGELIPPTPSLPQGLPVPPQPQTSPSQPSEAVQPQQPAAPTLEQALAELVPPSPKAPEFIDPTEETEGIGSYLSESEEAEEPSEREEVNASLSPLNPIADAVRRQQEQQPAKQRPAQEASQAVQSGQPLPRPRVAPQVIRGPLRNSPKGVARTGAISIDANFSEFGDYLQRVFETIGLRWDELNATGSVSETQSRIAIQFEINKNGQIQNLEVVASNAGRAAELRCLDAIQSPAPYYPWTPDMMRVLGDSQPVRVTFFYR